MGFTPVMLVSALLARGRGIRPRQISSVARRIGNMLILHSRVTDI